MKTTARLLSVLLLGAPCHADDRLKTAVQEALKAPSSSERESLLTQHGEAWGRMMADAASANSSLLPCEIPGHVDRKTFILSAADALADKSPQRALESVSKLPSGQAKRMAYAQVLRIWSAKEPSKALSWSIQHLAGSTRRDAVSQAVAVWAAKEPAKAAQWALDQATNPGEVSLMIQEIARIWGQTNPEACGDWCASLPPGDIKDLAMNSLITEWASRSPQSAAKWTQEPDREWLAPRVAHFWAQLSPLEAAEWVSSEMAASAMDPVVLTWADEAPEECLNWCLAKAPDMAETITEQVMQVWGNDAPEDAFTWIIKQKNSPLALRAASAAMGAWLGDSKTELKDINAWITRLPAGPVRDLCFEQLSYALNAAFPVQALTAAQKIHDKQMMNQAVRQNWLEWRKRDPFNARQWLNQNPNVEKIVYSTGEGQE